MPRGQRGQGPKRDGQGPKRDGQGPAGKGPKTGRGNGNCK